MDRPNQGQIPKLRHQHLRAIGINTHTAPKTQHRRNNPTTRVTGYLSASGHYQSKVVSEGISIDRTILFNRARPSACAVRFKLADSLEESDSKAGFYYDLKFLTCLAYLAFLVLIILSEIMLSIGIELGLTSLIFLSFVFFLDLQEFAEVRVPRYGWKGSRSDYRIASSLLATGIPLMLIAGSLMNSEVITRLPTSLSIILFFSCMGFAIIPVVGLIFYLIFILNFTRLHGFSLWARDRQILEVYSKHSFFYRKLFRRKKQI